MEDIVTGFIAIGAACILVLDLAAHIRISSVSAKLDQILAKLNK